QHAARPVLGVEPVAPAEQGPEDSHAYLLCALRRRRTTTLASRQRYSALGRSAGPARPVRSPRSSLALSSVEAKAAPAPPASGARAPGGEPRRAARSVSS